MERPAGGALPARAAGEPAQRGASRRLAAAWGLPALAALAYRDLLAWSPREQSLRPDVGLDHLFFEPYGESPLLILALAGWMLWRRRERLRAALAAPARPLLAGALLAGAVLAGLWARRADGLELLIPSLQLFALGAGALLGGSPALRALRLPVLFLLLAIPIPGVLLNQILFPLQLATAGASEAVLRLLGYDALAVGDRVFTPWRTFQVIETCSGLRLMQSLVMAAVFYADAVGRRPSRLAALLLAAPLVGWLVNVARALSIVFSQSVAVHTTQGVVMVVLGVLLLVGIDALLERPWPHARERAAARRGSHAAPRPRALAALVATLVAIGSAPLWVARWTPPPLATGANLHDLPHELAGSGSEYLDVDTTFLGSVEFSDRIHRRFGPPGAEVDVFVGENDRRRRGSLISPKTAYPGTAWGLEQRGELRLSDGLVVDALVFRSGRERRLVLHWRENTGGLAGEALRALLALDRSPLRRTQPAVVHRLATPVGWSDLDGARARARLAATAEALRRALAELRAR